MPTPLINVLVISANCHNEYAFGDYKIAGQLAYEFSKELPISSTAQLFRPISLSGGSLTENQNIEQVILLTTNDRLGRFTRLYGPRNTANQVNILDASVLLYSDEDFPISNYHVSAYIQANPCRDMPESSLKRILSPDTKMMELYGPHQPDFKKSKSSLARYNLKKINENISGSIFSYTSIYPEALGFMYQGSARLGLFPIERAETLKVTDAEQIYLNGLPANGNYAPAYIPSVSEVKTELLEYLYIASKMTKNFILIGHNRTTIKSILMNSSFPVYYKMGDSIEDMTKGSTYPAVTVQHFPFVSSNAFRKTMAGGIPLTLVSGVNGIQESLTDGRIIYLHNLEPNENFIKDYIRALFSFAKTQPQIALIKEYTITLAAKLVGSKPLSLRDKGIVIKLLRDTTVVQTLQHYNQSLMLASEAPIAKKLLPTLQRPLDLNEIETQIRVALETLKKPSDSTLPTYDQALRRAASNHSTTFELKVLIAYSAYSQYSINACTPDKRITPLHFAAQAGLFFNLIQLIQAGANLDQQDYKGRNPAYYAAKNQHSECLNTLIESGANITSYADDGKSALTLFRASPILQTSPSLVRSIDAVTPTLEHKAAKKIQAFCLGFFVKKTQISKRKIVAETGILEPKESILGKSIDRIMDDASNEQVKSKRLKKIEPSDEVVEHNRCTIV